MSPNPSESDIVARTEHGLDRELPQLLMNSILKVKHNNSSGQYCFCILERHSTGKASLYVYKTKKQLSEKQRLKAKVWFVHEISPSIIISAENSFTKFLFHIEDGPTNSSFSSQSSYNRDSWAQTLGDLCGTADDGSVSNHFSKGTISRRSTLSQQRTKSLSALNKSETSSPSRQGTEVDRKLQGHRGQCRGQGHGHTPSNPPTQSTRRQFLSKEMSEKETISSTKSLKKDAFEGDLNEGVYTSQIVATEAKRTKTTSPCITPAQKHLRATRQQFLTKMMSEKETEKAPLRKTQSVPIQLPIGGRSVDSSCSGTSCPESVEPKDTNPASSHPQATPQDTHRRSTRRQKFLNTIMAEKEKLSRTSRDVIEDEFDYVPPSTRKLTPPRRYDSETHRPALNGDSFIPYQYSTVDTPCHTNGKIHNEPSQQQNLNMNILIQTPQTPAQSKFLPTNLNFSAQSQSTRGMFFDMSHLLSICI